MNNLYKFIIPLFALAFLLVSCAKSAPTDTSMPPPFTPTPELLKAREEFDGTILSGKHEVILRTSKGDITLELDADAAPKTVTNFIALAKAGYYDGLTFHRVIPNFMIQGGDPSGNGSGGESVFGPTFEDEINANAYGLEQKTLQDQSPDEKLPAEFGKMTIKEFYENQGYAFNDDLPSIPFVQGTIAMANRGPNTNGSQFFIVHANEVPWLDGRHTVFGKVSGGMEVVDAIVGVERNAQDKPVEPVTFTVEVK